MVMAMAIRNKGEKQKKNQTKEKIFEIQLFYFIISQVFPLKKYFGTRAISIRPTKKSSKTACFQTTNRGHVTL
jgi:hypothetical protein